MFPIEHSYAGCCMRRNGNVEIFIAGGTGSCQNKNLQCSQWRKFGQNDNISVSVYDELVMTKSLSRRKI